MKIISFFPSKFGLIAILFFSCYTQVIAQSDESWAVVMSGGLGYTDQVWRTRYEFPEKEIKEYWDLGYNITNLTYGNGVWALVMSQGSGLGRQYWVSNNTFPQEQIQDYWDNHRYRITNLTHGDGKWAVIMSEYTPYKEQRWNTSEQFPEKEIKDFWSKGYFITNLDHGNGLWALVVSKGSGYADQIYSIYKDFPEAGIKEYWNKGYSITNLTYGDGVWVLIMSKGAGLGLQAWQTESTYPQKKINEYWAKGYYISGLYHGKYSSETPNAPIVYKKATVNWNTPYSNNTKVNKEDYTLKACVRTESPISKIEIYVNDVKQTQTQQRGFEVVPDDGCDQTIEKKVKLKPGNNIIKLSVTNKGGVTQAEVRTVVYSQPEIEIPNNTNTTNTEKRLALIIGNSSYANAPLKNPVNDARSMEVALKKVGFEVIKVENTTQKDLKSKIDEYGQKLRTGGYDVGLFFYAGHGMQVKGNNYLIPVDATVAEENEVEYECVDAGRVLAKMESAGSKVNIVILDACRNNPFERSWSRSTEGNGLATMDAPLGSIICYATSPGKTAADGVGNNGTYTEELLQNIQIPGLPIEDVFKRVRIGVVQKTNRQQTPWETSSMTGDFFFTK